MNTSEEPTLSTSEESAPVSRDSISDIKREVYLKTIAVVNHHNYVENCGYVEFLMASANCAGMDLNYYPDRRLTSWTDKHIGEKVADAIRQDGFDCGFVHEKFTSTGYCIQNTGLGIRYDYKILQIIAAFKAACDIKRKIGLCGTNGSFCFIGAKPVCYIECSTPGTKIYNIPSWDGRNSDAVLKHICCGKDKIAVAGDGFIFITPSEETYRICQEECTKPFYNGETDEDLTKKFINELMLRKTGNYGYGNDPYVTLNICRHGTPCTINPRDNHEYGYSSQFWRDQSLKEIKYALAAVDIYSVHARPGCIKVRLKRF